MASPFVNGHEPTIGSSTLRVRRCIDPAGRTVVH
jgi:hypothetical protein